MNLPICFSHHFSNKQNVRSLNNAINFKLLKSEDDVFLQHILEDKCIAGELTTELKKLVNDIKENIITCSKNDFQDYFSKVIEDKKLRSIDKSQVFIGCWKTLLKIIPSLFYGKNHNNKLFKKIVKTVLYSMNRQHFNFCDMIKGWDLSVFPWNTLPATASFKILYFSLLWILKKLLSSIIVLNFYVTTCKIDADENKLHFFWKNIWQRFYDKKISDMVTCRIINKFEPYSLGSKIKMKYSLRERSRIKKVITEIPKLHLVLKQNNDFRPIVRYKNNKSISDKNKIKEKLHFLRKLTGKPHEKIEKQFFVLIKKWEAKNKPMLYFVKTDLSNAFGAINVLKLFTIFTERYAKFQKEETSLYLKKKFEQNYKEFVIELKKPLLIRAGSTIYEWKEGLVQGYKYSPALSELYYSYMDEIYFNQHIHRTQEDIKLFIRVVDDYLYITDSLEDAHAFLKALSNYRNVNYNKTFVNFPIASIKFSQEIVFLGYSYNTKTMQVSRANTVSSGQMCFKIGFSLAIADLGKYLENRIGQSGIEINGHIFNFHYNSELLIWNHIFVTLCLSANKFCTILAILCDEREMFKYLPIYKRRVTVKLCNTIIHTLNRNKPTDFMFIYCINHFRYLSFKALLLCAQKTPKCNKMVPYINIELVKSNCLYGKWREHSSRISENGYCLKPAIKEICRRSDLRSIVRNCEVLPEGFLCFNQNSLYA